MANLGKPAKAKKSDFKKTGKVKGGSGGASAGIKVSFDSGKLERNLEQIDNRVRRASAGAALRLSPDIEAWMKANAPWQDQTSNARNGLTARPKAMGNTVQIVCAHGVPYGIWLEVRWGGKLSIIVPAIERFGPEFQNLVGRILDL